MSIIPRTRRLFHPLNSLDLQQNQESNHNPMKPVLYQQRQCFMLKSPHDSILSQNSAIMPIAQILLPPTQGHHQVQSWLSYYNTFPGTINNGNYSWTPYTSTAAPAPIPAPTLMPDYHQMQHPPCQHQEHNHQFKLMEVIPMPDPVPNGQPSPGEPSFVFRPTPHPAGPAPMLFHVNVTQPPVEGYKEQSSELLALQTGPQGQVRSYQGEGTHGMVQVAQMDAGVLSNLTQENYQIRASKELSKEIPTWEKHCIFCRSNGEPSSVYMSHVLKNDENKTVCPILMKYKCPFCEKTGEEAHTLKYCPRKRKNLKMTSASRSSKIHLAKQVRSSTGKTYILKY